MATVIDIGADISNGQAQRQLHIERVTADGQERDDLIVDGEYEYNVVASGGLVRYGANFTHRYGDDVWTLITKAIAALREAGMPEHM